MSDKVQGLGQQIYSIELRDLMAMALLVGSTANPTSASNVLGNPLFYEGLYKCADMMLKARKPREAPNVGSETTKANPL